MPALSVIVPVRDGAAHLGRLLDALARQRGAPEHEVLVVDNGSRDATADLAAGHALRPRVLRLPRGGGPGAARNVGVRAATASSLAFVDADCAPAPGWLAAGAAALRGADLVQGAVRADPAVPAGPFDRSLWVDRPRGLFESANLFVRRAAWARAGGFPEGAAAGVDAPPFGEDVEFGWRVVRGGGRAAFAPDALVFHAVTPRGAAAFVADRRRLALFPALARQVPELRERAFCARIFLSRRTAAFDLAVAGAALAAGARRPAALTAAVPYALVLGRDARRWGPLAGRVAAVGAAADAAGLAALAAGSLRARSLLL